jgi:hypothetical protein
MIPILLALLAVDAPQFDFRTDANRCVATVKASQPLSAYWIGSTSGNRAESVFVDTVGDAKTEYRYALQKGAACPDPKAQRVLAAIYADGSSVGETDYIAAILGARRADLATTQRWIDLLTRRPERMRTELSHVIEAMPFSGNLQESVIQGTITNRVRSHALEVRKDIQEKGNQFALDKLKRREAMLLASKPAIEP